MHIRLWETQQRKQPAREQQQEAKVQEVMDKEKSEEDHRLDQEDKDEKEQQTQMEGEVRDHYNIPALHVSLDFWYFIMNCRWYIVF